MWSYGSMFFSLFHLVLSPDRFWLTLSCRIPRLQGGAECTLTAMAELTATTNRVAWARPPIDVDFQVLMFTASGLLVRFLKVFEKSNYNSVKWVRYLTKAAGSYQIRVRPPFFPFIKVVECWQGLSSFDTHSFVISDAAVTRTGVVQRASAVITDINAYLDWLAYDCSLFLPQKPLP